MLPGIGLLYWLNEDTALLGGVHKAFTAPSNAEGVREESALKWELGFRSFRDSLSIEAVAFLSDYDNLPANARHRRVPNVKSRMPQP